jgi:Pentapeptide repeats (9 copies)
MSRYPATLQDWRRALERADEGPYIGFRSQTAKRDQPEMLVGRAEDLERITAAVLQRPLVVLDGYSGVGKSSLLKNGLYSRLEQAGFAILVSSRWPSVPEGLSESPAAVERYLAKAIKTTHDDPLMPLEVPARIDMERLVVEGELCATLDREYEDSGAVLILDQFEELLREHSRTVAPQVVEWIVSAGYRYQTRIVLSLRTDSLHVLEPLLRGVRPFSMDRVRIDELSDRNAIEKVVRTTKQSSTEVAAISDAAVAELLQLWDVHKPKLLALQATLYALYFRSQPSRPPAGATAMIEAAGVTGLVEDAQAAGVDAFALGFREAIRLKIDHAEAACREHVLDEYLINGTRDVIRRIAPYLSSGTRADFKIPLPELELAHRALAREVQVLQGALAEEICGDEVDTGRMGAIAEASVDQLFAELRRSPDFLNAQVDSGARRVEKRHTLRRPDVSAGPMMGRSARATLLEEVRRVAFAVEWLEYAEIVRRDPEGVLLLVHDGSGAALRAWAAAQVLGPNQALWQLTGSRGEHYAWVAEVGGDRFRVVANLSWRDCRVTARFRNVVFVNCDFSGSTFDACTLHGATFVNCLLDDVHFVDCTILGVTSLEKVYRRRETGTETVRVAPSFLVETPAVDLEQSAPYLVDAGQAAPSNVLFSDTSGAPAVVGAVPPGHLGATIARFIATGRPPVRTALEGVDGAVSQPEERAPAAGGMAMVGGRLCLLTLYRCTADGDAAIAFHHVSGDGLQVVEQRGGGIEIHGSAIRGLSLSRDDDGDPPHSQTRAPVRVVVNDSVLANTYVADGLRGTADVERSLVLMLMNASRTSTDGFEVFIRDCRYQFLVNTQTPADGSTEDSRDHPEGTRYFHLVAGTHSCFEADNRDGLARDLEAMDYRFRPEVWEALQRRRRAQARLSRQR